jgi:ferredoxin
MEGPLVAMSLRLHVDPVRCTGHGLCADLLPERIQLDEWGFPIVRGDLPLGLAPHARRAVRACPVLALKITRTRSRPDEKRARRREHDS